MIAEYFDILTKWASVFSFDEKKMENFVVLIAAITVILVAVVVYYAILFLIRKIAFRVVSRTPNKIDDEFYQGKFFQNVSIFFPLSIVNNGFKRIFADYDLLHVIASRVLDVSYVIVILMILFSLLNVWDRVYSKKYKEGRSLKSIMQAIKMVAAIICLVIVISILFNLKIDKIMKGLGAASAVLLLVFKDTIMGFVASIQLANNRMVLLGDWIEMPQYGADGKVVEISLVSVKVQNGDNTISTIPTYSMVSQSVKNWRYMSEIGRRRIKRSLYIDMSSVKFVDEELESNLLKVEFIRDYLESTNICINFKCQTNIGIFRAYLMYYLKSIKDIDSNTSTFLVRQLQPTDMGIPMEIYVYTKTTDFVKYEDIQSSIFDHIMACVHYFDLRIYQRPSWYDYKTKEIFSLKMAEEKQKENFK